MKELFTIVLVHLFSKERRVVPVESVAATYVSIRWGQSGTYDLNLAKNVLTSRSQKAQRKGKAHWSAEDIAAVRKLVRDHLKGGDKAKEEMRQAILKHNARMPIPAANDNRRIAFVPGVPQPTDLNFIPRVFGKMGNGQSAVDASDRVVSPAFFGGRFEAGPRFTTGRSCDPKGSCSDTSCNVCWMDEPANAKASDFYSQPKPRFELTDFDELDLPPHVAPMAEPRDHEKERAEFESAPTLPCDALPDNASTTKKDGTHGGT